MCFLQTVSEQTANSMDEDTNHDNQNEDVQEMGTGESEKRHHN